MATKKTTYIATWGDREYTRTSARAYTHASVVRWSTGEEVVLSFHGSRELALKGSLTGWQKEGGARVIDAVEVTVR